MGISFEDVEERRAGEQCFDRDLSSHLLATKRMVRCAPIALNSERLSDVLIFPVFLSPRA